MAAVGARAADGERRRRAAGRLEPNNLGRLLLSCAAPKNWQTRDDGDLRVDVGAGCISTHVLDHRSTTVAQDSVHLVQGADRLREVLEGGLARKAELGLLNGFMMRCTLSILRRRAYSPAQFERLVAESAFRTCHIKTEGIGLEARMKKQVAADKEESTLQDTR